MVTRSGHQLFRPRLHGSGNLKRMAIPNHHCGRVRSPRMLTYFRREDQPTMRMLVSHSTRDTRVRVLWRFIDELQIALNVAGVPIQLVNVVSECGTKQVPDLPGELRSATAATDLTMIVLTQGYVNSMRCDDEMHGRAQSSCRDCPSHRLFPVRWRTYPWDKLWSRSIEGWG